MSEQRKDEMRQIAISELKALIAAFLAFFIFLKLHYYAESAGALLKTTAAHFYLFILPGYSLMLAAYDKYERLERMILGIGLGYGVPTFLAYAVNVIFKKNMMTYYWIIPIIVIAAGTYFFARRR